MSWMSNIEQAQIVFPDAVPSEHFFKRFNKMGAVPNY